MREDLSDSGNQLFLRNFPRVKLVHSKKVGCPGSGKNSGEK